MPRFLVIIGFSLLMTGSAFAQDPTPMQCQMIRLAVAQYGYAAAKQHALQTYGPEAVRTGEKCFTKEARRGGSARTSREFDGERSAGMR